MNTPSNVHPGKLAQTIPTEGLLRVRRISRYLKAMVLFYFVVLPVAGIVTSLFLPGGLVGNVHVSPEWAAASAAGKLVLLISSVLYMAIAATAYRLLNLFEKGAFFLPANVRLLRVLGHLIFSNGLLKLIGQAAASGQFPNILQDVISSPWVVGGLFVIMVSHIMEEGCKMREEQELTV